MLTAFLTAAIVFYSILGGALYMIRGGGIGSDIPATATEPARGGLLNISDWLKRHGLPAPRDLVIIGAFLMPIINTPILYYGLGVAGWHLLYVNVALGGGYIVAFMQGWGEYFDIGTWVNYYKGHREVLWVDWILYKIFGPEWIPNNPSVTPDNPDFDLIPSPTGDVNPYEWRRRRDTVGMGLRHLMSVFVFGSLGLVAHYFLGATWATAGIIAGLTIPFAIGTALIYLYFMRPGVTWPTNPVYRINQPTGRAEGATGALFHLLIAIAFVILLIA